MAKLYRLFISPAVAILNRLGLTAKFALIFVLYLIPVGYVAISSTSEQMQLIDAVKLEKIGLEYMAGIRPIFEHMAQTRGMTNAYLQGKTELKRKISGKRAIVETELLSLLDLDTKYGQVLQIGERAKSIQKDWSRVVNNAFTMKPEEAFSAHTDVINKVLALNEYILETSALIVTPKIDDNFMANALSVRLPVLVETMGKARGLGAGVATAGEATSEVSIKLTGFVQTIENANVAMSHGYDVVFENNSIARKKLASLVQSANSVTQQFIHITRANLLETDSVSTDPLKYFSMGTDAISSNLKLYDATLPLLDEILTEDIRTLENNIRTTISISVLLLIVTAFLFGGFYHGLMNSIKSIKDAVHSMAEGDLTVEVKLEAKDEMQLIANDMNMMIEKTNALVSQVISAANLVVSSSDQSSVASNSTREGVDQQNMELELVATAMNEMSATVHDVARNASHTAEATREADKAANNGRAVVNQTIVSINELSEKMQQASGVIQQVEQDSESIGSVLDVIRGIAEQTNLLALNAAIEAARAGEQGRGFAVVADEVRTLAGRTQDSTQEIQSMIEKLQYGAQSAVKVMEEGVGHTEKTVSQAGEAGTTLEAIAKAVDNVAMMNDQIASAAEEQSAVAEEINRNVVNVRDISLNTAENANQTTQSSSSLKEVASQLQVLVSEFKVN